MPTENEFADVELAREAVAQMFGVSKTDMTEVEVNMWRYEIDRCGPALMLKFVRFWIGGGGQGTFMRAPRIDDFLRRVDPEFVSADDALTLLRNLVRKIGPYSDPDISNAKLRLAVMELGGWAKVNQDLPDSSEEFASKRFAERFKTAWLQSEAAEIQGRLSCEPLLGIASEAKKQLVIQAYSVDTGAESNPTFQP